MRRGGQRAFGSVKTSGRRGVLIAGAVVGAVSLPALAGPKGESVAAGRATFQRSGNTTTITTSHKAIIDYSSFDLGKNESVIFVQPNQSSRVLNRIESAMPTMIDGAVTANGSVYFSNPAGVIFGPNSVLNVGNLFAAAGHISNEDFLAGRNRFTDVQGEVINYGTISAREQIALIGRRVANFGTLVAPEGMITLAADDGVLIGRRGGHVYAKLTGESFSEATGSVENHGVIDAGEGQIQLGVGDHFALALGAESKLTAGRVLVEGGEGSRVNVGGSIDASSGANGGVVEVTGGSVALRGAAIDASGRAANGSGGAVRIGGDIQGKGALANADVTAIDAASTIDVNARGSGDAGVAVVWSDGQTLFQGSIEGRAESGDGAFVEVSGKQWLGFEGAVDVSSVLGQRGALLLDPKNILITSASSGVEAEVSAITSVDDFLDANILGGNDGNVLVDDALTSNITDAQLVTLLSTGDVILLAENDILFGGNAAVDITSASGFSLDLRALRSITDNSTAQTSAVNIDLTGDFIARANYAPSSSELARVSNRDAGDAVISLSNTTITADNVALQIGAGWDGARSGGDILLPTINATGTVLAQTIATRAESGDGSIVGTNAVSGARVVYEVGGGLGGSIGADGSPVSLDPTLVSLEASGGVYARFTGAASTVSLSQDSDVSFAGMTLTGGFVTGIDAGSSMVAISSPLDLEIGDDDAGLTGLSFDDSELALMTFGGISFASDGDLALNDDTDDVTDVFSRFGGVSLDLVGGDVSIVGEATAGTALAVSSLGVTASTSIDLSTLNVGVGSVGAALSFTTPEAIGLVSGAGTFTLDTAMLGTFTFDSLSVTSTGDAVDLTVNSAFTGFDSRALDVTGTSVSVSLADGVLLATNAASLTATSGAITLAFPDGGGGGTGFLGGAGGTLSFDVQGEALLGDVVAGGGESLVIDRAVLESNLDGSIAVTSLGDVSLVDLADGFGYLAGDSLLLSGANVSIAGVVSNTLPVLDLVLVGSASVSLSPLAGVGSDTDAGTVSITSAESIGLFDGAGDLLFDGGDLGSWSFQDWSFTSTGGAIDATDADGDGAAFDVFNAGTDAGALSLRGTSVTLGTDDSNITLRSLSLAATSGGITLNGLGASAILLDDGGAVGAGAVLSFETPETIELGGVSGTGNFELASTLVDGWTFERLDLTSTSGSVQIDGAGNTLFTDLAGLELSAVASGSVSVIGSGVDAVGLGLASFDGGAGVVWSNLGSVDLGTDWIVRGGLSVEGTTTVLSDGDVFGGVAVTSGNTLTIDTGVTFDVQADTDGVARVTLSGGQLEVNGTMRAVSADELILAADALAGLEWFGTGGVNANNAIVSFGTVGGLRLGGTSSTADVDVTESFVDGLTGFTGLGFRGASIDSNGSSVYYAGLTSNELGGDGPMLSFIADGVVSFDADAATTVGTGASSLLIDAGGNLGDGTLAALAFGTNISGLTSLNGSRLAGVSVTTNASAGFTIANDASLVLGAGVLSTTDGGGGAAALTVDGLRIGALDGGVELSTGDLTVNTDLSSVYGIDALDPTLSLTATDIALAGGATLSTGAGLLSIIDGADASITIGAGSGTDVEISADEFSRITFGSLALTSDVIEIVNDNTADADIVFGALAGGDLTLNGTTSVTLTGDANGVNGGVLSVNEFVVSGADLFIDGAMTSITAATSSLTLGNSVDLTGVSSAGITLDFGSSVFDAPVLDATGLSLTLLGTVAQVSDVVLTAEAITLGAALNLQGTQALELVIGSYTRLAPGQITNYADLVFDAGSSDLFIGEATGIGLTISTANLANFAPAAGGTLRFQTDGTATFEADALGLVDGRLANLAAVTGSDGVGNAGLIVWDGGTLDAQLGGSPARPQPDPVAFTFDTDRLLASRFDAFEIRSDARVSLIEDDAAPGFLAGLNGLVTVFADTLTVDARTLDIDVAGTVGAVQLAESMLTNVTNTIELLTDGSVVLNSGAGAFDYLSGRVLTVDASALEASGAAGATGVTFQGTGLIAADSVDLATDAGTISFGAGVTGLTAANTSSLVSGNPIEHNGSFAYTGDFDITGDLDAGGLTLSFNSGTATLNAVGDGLFTIDADTVGLVGATVVSGVDDGLALNLTGQLEIDGASSLSTTTTNERITIVSVGGLSITVGDVSGGTGLLIDTDEFALIDLASRELSLETTGTVELIEDGVTPFLDTLPAGLFVTADGLLVDARARSLGFNGAAGDVQFGSGQLGQFTLSTAFTALTDGAITLNAGTNFDYLAGLDITLGASAASGAGNAGAATITFAGNSTPLAVNAFSAAAVGDVSFGTLSGVTSSGGGQVTSDAGTIVHGGSFVYDGDFTLSDALDATGFTLTFQGGTTTLDSAGNGTGVVTADSVVIASDGVLSAGAADGVRLALSSDLTLDGSLTTTDAGETITIEETAGGAIRVGDATGASGLAIDDVEFANIDQSGGRVLELIGSSVEFAENASLTFLDTLPGTMSVVAPSVSFDARNRSVELGGDGLSGGFDLTEALLGQIVGLADLTVLSDASVDFSTDGGSYAYLNGLGLAVAGSDISGAGNAGAGAIDFDGAGALIVDSVDLVSDFTVTFGSGVTSLVSSNASSIASADSTIIHEGDFGYAGDFDLFGTVDASGFTLSFAGGTTTLAPEGGAAGTTTLRADTLNVLVGAELTTPGTSNSLEIELSGQLAIDPGAVGITVFNGATFRLVSTNAGGIDLGDPGSSDGLLIDSAELTLLNIAGATFELQTAGDVSIDDSNNSASTLFASVANAKIGLPGDTVSAIVVGDAALTDGQVNFGSASFHTSGGVTFDSTLTNVTFGADSVLGASTIAFDADVAALFGDNADFQTDSLSFNGLSGTFTTGLNTTVGTGDPEEAVVIDGSAIGFQGSGFSVAGQDLTIEANTVDVSAGVSTDQLLTFDFLGGDLGLFGGSGAVVLDETELGFLSFSFVDFIASGLDVSGTDAQLDPFFQGGNVLFTSSSGEGAAVAFDVTDDAAIGFGTNIGGVFVSDFFSNFDASELAVETGGDVAIFESSASDFDAIQFNVGSVSPVGSLTFGTSLTSNALDASGIDAFVTGETRFEAGFTSLSGDLAIDSQSGVFFDATDPFSLESGTAFDLRTTSLIEFAGDATLGRDLTLDSALVDLFVATLTIADGFGISETGATSLVVTADDLEFASAGSSDAAAIGVADLTLVSDSIALGASGSGSGIVLDDGETQLLSFGSLTLLSDGTVAIGSGAAAFIDGQIAFENDFFVGGNTGGSASVIEFDGGGAGVEFGTAPFMFPDALADVYSLDPANVSADLLDFRSDVGVAITGGQLQAITVSGAGGAGNTPIFAIDGGANPIGIGDVGTLFGGVDFSGGVVLATLGTLDADILGLFSDAGVYFANDVGNGLASINILDFTFGGAGGAGTLDLLAIDAFNEGVLIGDSFAGTANFLNFDAADLTGFGGPGATLELRSNTGVVIANDASDGLVGVLDDVNLLVSDSQGGTPGLQNTPTLTIDAFNADLFLGGTPTANSLSFDVGFFSAISVDSLTLLTEQNLTIADSNDLFPFFQSLNLELGAGLDGLGSLNVDSSLANSELLAEDLTVFVDGTANIGANVDAIRATGDLRLDGGLFDFAFAGETQIQSSNPGFINGSFSTVGSFNFVGDTLLSGATIDASGGVTFQETVTLFGESDSSITSGGDVNFQGQVLASDREGLSIDLTGAGLAVNFDDQVGQSFSGVGSLNIDGFEFLNFASTIDGETLTAFGTGSSMATFNDDVQLGSSFNEDRIAGRGESYAFELTVGSAIFADDVSVTDFGGGQMYTVSTITGGNRLDLDSNGQIIIDLASAAPNAFDVGQLNVLGSSVTIRGGGVTSSARVTVDGFFTLGSSIVASEGVAFNNGVLVDGDAVSIDGGIFSSVLNDVSLVDGSLDFVNQGGVEVGRVSRTGSGSFTVNTNGILSFLSEDYVADVLDFFADGYSFLGSTEANFGDGSTTHVAFGGGEVNAAGRSVNLDASSGTVTLGSTFIADTLNVAAQMFEAGALGDALRPVNTLTLAVDDADLNGAVNASTVFIDTLDAGRSISLGTDVSGALALGQMEIADGLNGGASPVSNLFIGMGGNGGIDLDGALFNANTTMIGNGSSQIMVTGTSGATGAGTGTFSLVGPIALDSASVISVGRSLFLDGMVAVSGASSLVSNGGDIVIGGSEVVSDNVIADGAGASLNVSAGGGTVALPIIGFGATPLGSLIVSGDTIGFNGNVNANAQTYTANTYSIDDASGVTLLATGGVSFNAVGRIETNGRILQIGTEVNPIGGNVNLASVVGNGSGRLGVIASGSVNSNGTLGLGSKLTSVFLSGSQLSLGDAFTTGNQTYTGAGGVALSSTLTSDNGAISIDGPFTVNTNSDLNANAVDFGGAVTLLADLVVNAPVVSLLSGLNGGANAITVNGTTFNVAGLLDTGIIDINATLALQDDTTLRAAAGDAMVTLEDVTAAGSELTVIAGNATETGGFSVANLAGVGDLLIQVDSILEAPNSADVASFSVQPFQNTTGISVGGAVAGTLNVSQEFLDALAASGAPITIGGDGFNGAISVNNPDFPADALLSTAFRIEGNGFSAVAGSTVTLSALTSTTFNKNVFLSEANPGAFDLLVTGPAFAGGPSIVIATGGGTATFGAGIDALNTGVSGLTFDLSGGDLSVADGIGQSKALSNFAVNSPGGSVKLPSVTTFGAQTYTAGTVAITDVALDSGSGPLSFDANVEASGTNTLTGGAISFAGALSGSGSTSVTGSGVTFSEDVTGFTGTLSLDAPLSVPEGRFIAAGTLELLQGASATGSLPVLSLQATDRLTFLGGAGSDASRFGQITMAAPSVVLGGDFFAQNGILVDGNALVAGAETLLRTYTLAADAGITFTGTVDSASVADGGVAGGAVLTLYVNRSDDPEASVEVPAGLIPSIELFDDIGQINPLDTLNLNFSGSIDTAGIEVNNSLLPARTFVPVETSIVLGDSDAFAESGALDTVRITVGSFNVGDREKLFVVGTAVITGTEPNTARIGDITALGDLVVSSPNVVLVAREAGEVFDSTNNIFTADLGTDIVAGGTITIGNITQIVDLTPGANRPQFANPTGDPDLNSNVGQFTAFALTDDLVGLALADGNRTLTVDVRAEGATNTDLATVLAGATPRNDGETDIDSQAEIDAAVLATLRELGINARPAGEADARIGLVNLNLPEDPDDQPAVSADRLQADVVALVIEAYRELFLAEREGETVNRRLEIERSITNAVDAYFDETDAQDFELERFVEFTSTSEDPEVAEAVAIIADLQDLLQLVKLLGLTTRELSGPKNTLFGRVRPRDISRDDWDAIIEGRVLGGAQAAVPSEAGAPVSLKPVTPPIRLGFGDATASSLWFGTRTDG
ncbi:MAG: filamentous hemagglutinin N-terminal domain-containing protein [Planctomycetota bacterium]